MKEPLTIIGGIGGSGGVGVLLLLDPDLVLDPEVVDVELVPEFVGVLLLLDPDLVLDPEVVDVELVPEFVGVVLLDPEFVGVLLEPEGVDPELVIFSDFTLKLVMVFLVFVT